MRKFRLSRTKLTRLGSNYSSIGKIEIVQEDCHSTEAEESNRQSSDASDTYDASVDKQTHAKVAEEIENGNNSPSGFENKQENGKDIEINASQTHIETPPRCPEVSQASQASLDSNLPSYVHRIHPRSDLFGCEHCKRRDDKCGMANHSHPEVEGNSK